MDHRTRNAMAAIDAFSDWLEEWDLPLTEDTADEYVSARRDELAHYERSAIWEYAEQFGEVDLRG